ncbi:S8 family serine peptidase [Thermus sp.]|uniref:S8 family serine peptidase n=1 Tax=Thermus sp. TaxID=275 RepID=UPI003D11E902
MKRTWTLLFSLLLLTAGCALEAPLLRLSLGKEEVRVAEGGEATLPVRVEARGLRARLRVEGLPQKMTPAEEEVEGKRELFLSFLGRQPGTWQARVVAEGGGMRREASFRLVVEGASSPDLYLEGAVYVGGEGTAPQAATGRMAYCPKGCPGRPLGGGWYRVEGLAPQALGGPSLPDRPLLAQGGEAEPLFPEEWNLPLARFPEAWREATGEGVVVAVADTGVLPGHPDLQGALLPGLDLLDGDTDPTEPAPGSPSQTFHGSHVSGILAAAWNGVGMAGASQAKLLPIRLLTPEGRGRESDLLLALRWAAGIPVPGLPPNPYPARVVNLSLSGEGPCSPALQEALDEVRARGVLVVVAAGNYGRDYRDYFPGNCRGVLAVGAVGPDGRLAPYSNRYAPLLAPGGSGDQGVLGPSFGGYRYLQGTSQAAPHVSAALALLASLGEASPQALEGALLAGSRTTPEGRLLDAQGALAALRGGGVALRVEGSLALRPGEEGSLPVEVLSPYPVRVGVEAPGLAAYLAPNPAQGPAYLRVRAPSGTPPGEYRVFLRAGEAQAEAQVRVGEVAARVVLEACPASGTCRTLTLPAAGGPFRLEGLSPGPYRLLAFLDRDGDGLLDPEEPRGEAEAAPPQVGIRVVVP